MYCFEDDKVLGTAGAQHLFNAAGASKSAATATRARRRFGKLEAAMANGSPPEGRADGAGARRGGVAVRPSPCWTEGSFF